MTRSQRAKQFSPFDVVAGLRQALKEKEKIRIPRKEISEDTAEEIDRILRNLENGQIITVVWYNSLKENHIQTTGQVKNINAHKKFIQIETITIFFR